MAAARQTAIRATGLEKRYRSGDAELVVFSDLELEVAQGERLAIVGESGAGKSTLLHLLGGLDRPTKGTIYFGEKELTKLGDAELAEFRNREIGFVWQSHYLLPEFTALENVMMPLLIRGVAAETAAEVARARLQEVGLGQRLHHRAGELSGGEQQRVALARALVGGPRVLLAEMHHAHGLTSVYVTHNLSFARRCDRVLKLEGGMLSGLDESSGSGSHPRN